MLKVFSGFCLFLAAGLLIYMHPTVQFYKKTKSQRLYTLWKNDVSKLEQQEEFKKMLLNVGEVELVFTDPQVEEELTNLIPAIKITKGAQLKLKVAVIRWIDKNRFGYVLQHEVFDSTEDKLFEFGRTYKVGFIW